jgi:carbamoyltransferase
MQGARLGPAYSDCEIESTLAQLGAVYQRLETSALLDRVVVLLQQAKVIGWFQGRMEFGPRALGGRSILGDARSRDMQTTMNLKIKFRESFRPFAPIVLRERVQEYFELDEDSPYMLLVAPVREGLRMTASADSRPDGPGGLDRIRSARSSIPAVTHVDYSARIQTVDRGRDPLLHELLGRFERATGCGVLVNTSFNVRGEPIVCTPDDAYRCFMNTEMDFLVLGHCLIERTAQPQREIKRRGELIVD